METGNTGILLTALSEKNTKKMVLIWLGWALYYEILHHLNENIIRKTVVFWD